MKKKTKQVPVPVKEKNKFKDKFFAYLLAGCMIFWTIASVLGIVGFANSIEKEKAVESSTAVAVSADDIHQVRDKKGARQVKDKQKVLNTEGTILYNFHLHEMNKFTFSSIETSSPVQRIVTSCQIQRVGTTIYFFWRNQYAGDNLQHSAIFEVGNETYSGLFTFTSIDEILAFSFTADIVLPNGVIPSSNDFCPVNYSIISSPIPNSLDGSYLSIKVTEQYIGKGAIQEPFEYTIRLANDYIDAQGDMYSSTGDWKVPNDDEFTLGFSYIEGVSFIDVLTSSNYEYGYNAGYDEGRLDGRNDGYQSGYTAGQSVGYNQGYSQGLLDNGGEWSFRSLLTAVVDTPVQVFTDLFNFEILGVNLTGFFLGLFSIALCLGVIKLIF